MDLEVAVGLVVGAVIAGLWDQPGVRPGWLLLAGLTLLPGIFSVNWVAIVIGVVALLLAFTGPASGDRGG